MRARSWVSFALGIGVGYLANLAVSSMSGHASITISEICSPEPDGRCIFKRVETTYGIDYTATTAFFRSLSAAKRGGYSTARVECTPETFVHAIWKTEYFVIAAEDGICDFHGEMDDTFREIFNLEH